MGLREMTRCCLNGTWEWDGVYASSEWGTGVVCRNEAGVKGWFEVDVMSDGV